MAQGSQADIIALLMVAFGSTPVIPPDHQGTTYPSQYCYQIPVSGVDCAHRILQVLRIAYQKHGIDTSLDPNYKPIQMNGTVCIHSAIATHPRFADALRDPACKEGMGDALRPRMEDRRSYDLHRKGSKAIIFFSETPPSPHDERKITAREIGIQWESEDPSSSRFWSDLNLQ